MFLLDLSSFIVLLCNVSSQFSFFLSSAHLRSASFFSSACLSCGTKQNQGDPRCGGHPFQHLSGDIRSSLSSSVGVLTACSADSLTQESLPSVTGTGSLFIPAAVVWIRGAKSLFITVYWLLASRRISRSIGLWLG